MHLFPALQQQYSREHLTARDAQQLAHLISFGPVVFQVARLMTKYGIYRMLADDAEGLTQADIANRTGLSGYAVKCLTEAALTMGTILVDTGTERFTLSKTGWFLLNDPLIQVNMDFNHDVNYEGWFRLEESLVEGRPAGLEHFGSWATIYEGLSSLPGHVQRSWFGFDHYYSDNSFSEALQLIFSRPTLRLLDVGGNTGRFALRCVVYNPDVRVTICDLPQQLELMRRHIADRTGAGRIDGIGVNMLDAASELPADRHFDAIWMSQFLDCFSETEIVSILRKAAAVMQADTRLYIMETLWDRQKYAPAAFCLTQISLYFTALANGNSKMYNTDDLCRLIALAGLETESIHDNIGTGGHSILVCRLPQTTQNDNRKPLL